MQTFINIYGVKQTVSERGKQVELKINLKETEVMIGNVANPIPFTLDRANQMNLNNT